MVGEMVALNATNSMAYTVANVSSGWLAVLTIVVFIVLALSVFLVYKNFRRIIYGACVAIPIAILGYISYSIAKPAKEGDWTPIITLIGIILALGFFGLLGYGAERLGIFAGIEESLEIDEKPTKKKRQQ